MSRFIYFLRRQVLFFLFSVLFFGCNKVQDMTLAEIAEITASEGEGLVFKTLSKPYNDDVFKDGLVGGVWQDSILSDPKTFNQLIAERDAVSAGIVSMMLDYLVDYDFSSRQWKPHLAFFEIEIDQRKETLTVHYTLRDGLYWTWYGSDRKIPVTSDDFCF